MVFYETISKFSLSLYLYKPLQQLLKLMAIQMGSYEDWQTLLPDMERRDECILWNWKFISVISKTRETILSNSILLGCWYIYLLLTCVVTWEWFVGDLYRTAIFEDCPIETGSPNCWVFLHRHPELWKIIFIIKIKLNQKQSCFPLIESFE